ncbi:fatty acid synthase-like isoform X1 [Photinus pyralis]|uniref:fatty acid synthase-like isoform X1 n=1 Tax=Photinus pyralis TaxID=7054 RepID=UPI00126724C2|nr:fatty acid synthase-like isoform X1 [Photinus pyralis]
MGFQTDKQQGFKKTQDSDDELVISGMAGCFAESANVYEYRDNLANKVDMVTCDERRWVTNHPEIPKRAGKMNFIEKFDSGFFGVHGAQAHSMDPMARMQLERTIEAILDAGYHPEELKGTRTGVFIGMSESEADEMLFYPNLTSPNFGGTGCTRSMHCSWISHILHLDGPSVSIDSACNSSLTAIEHAFSAIRLGKCDAAIVAAGHLCLKPKKTLEFSRLGVLSGDGRCKSFDQSANGYVRSEAVGALFVQNVKAARRIYAKIINAKTNCDGYKEQGISVPAEKGQKALLMEFYRECGVEPSSIDFLETHGPGTKIGDRVEISVTDSMFCTSRQKPLYVGSAKSNHGHAEGASGFCAVAKVLLSMEGDILLPNINFSKTNYEAFVAGRMAVVTDVMPWPEKRTGLVAVNNFGFGGANAHLLLERHTKVKVNGGIPEDDLSRLVCFSGRTGEAVDAFIADLERRELDAEFVRLLHEIFSKPMDGHLHRGFVIVTKSAIMERSRSYNGMQRAPLCLLFGGPNSTLVKHSQSLLKFPIGALTLKRIQTELNSSIPELTDFLNKGWQNSQADFVLGTVLSQLILAELLKCLKLDVAHVVGYSTGEIAAGYMTHSLSLEEAVALGFHLAESLRTFDNNGQTYLKENIPAIPSANGHQDLNIEKMGDNSVTLLKHQQKLVSDLKSRLKPSVRFPKKSSAHNGANRKFSPEVLISSMFTPCRDLHPKLNLFFLHAEEDLSHFGNVSTEMQLRMEPDQHFLVTLGKLYERGYNATLSELYPPISWPISARTPSISPLIKWNHEDDWFVALSSVKENAHANGCPVVVKAKNKNWQFITGHLIDGRCLIPATAYLKMVWDIYVEVQKEGTLDLRIVFEDVQFKKATYFSEEDEVKLFVSVHKTTGAFEVAESGVVVVTGRMRTVSKSDSPMLCAPITGRNELRLDKTDIYKELKLRGYNYSGLFRGVDSCALDVTDGSIEWADNWTTFMDNMLQMKILHKDTRSLYVPTYIERVIIDQDLHRRCLYDGKLPVRLCAHSDTVRAGGVEIKGLGTSAISKRKILDEPVLEAYKFVPFEGRLNLVDAVRVNTQIVIENSRQLTFNCVEVVDDSRSSEPITPILQQALGEEPLIQPNLVVLSSRDLAFDAIDVRDQKLAEGPGDHLLVIVANALRSPQLLEEALMVLKDGGFVLSREDVGFHQDPDGVPDVEMISVYETEAETLVLLQKRKPTGSLTIVDLDNVANFTWLPALQALVKYNKNVMLVAQNDSTTGVLGLFNCLKMEPYTEKVRCMYIADESPKFDVNTPLYATQLKMGLTVNVYKGGRWGTYRHLPLARSQPVPREHIFSHALTVGDLSSLVWSEGPLKRNDALPPGESLVNVDYSALNFRDVLTASGRISADVYTADRLEHQIVQGVEFSGRLSSGERVFGMVRDGALSTLVLANPSMMVTVPDDWSVEDAATVTVAYATVLLCLEHEARIKKGQSILIHSGTGGVGQAAINVAVHYECDIFVTVGTEEKRNYLRQRFPQIPDRHIGSSRSTTFEQMILKETRGRGVDLVLNSLSEDKLQASLRCLARGGKFLEIGKFYMQNNSRMKCETIRNGCSFHSVMLDMFFGEIPSRQKFVFDLLRRGIEKGAVKPLPRVVFKKEQVEEAFRFMAGGKHMGKILLKISDDGKSPLFYGVPRFYGNFENCSIIVGGLGGFGLELAEWLVLRGVKKLVLVSRAGVRNGYQAAKIKNWERCGVTTLVSTENVATREGCVELLRRGNQLGPVESIFNLAVILKDAILENQTVEMFEEAFRPKAVVTKFLDEMSREMCPKLRQFVVFSSVICGRGNAGQANYAMANSVMERICERRKRDGYPGLAIQWGAIGEVGLVAEREGSIRGTLPQKVSSCLGVLDTFLSQDEPVVSSIVVAEKTRDCRGSQKIVDSIMRIMGIKDLKSAGMHKSFSHMGLDSIIAVELKQTLVREFNADFSDQEVRDLTFARLQAMESGKAVDFKNSSVMARVISEMYMLLPNVDENMEESSFIVKQKSLVSEANNAPSVFLLPGLNGVCTIMEMLSANLNCHAYCLRYDESATMIEELSQQALLHLPSAKEPFTVIAYSFGCIVALHLVSQLETKGYRGQLILIDGSHSVFKRRIAALIPNVQDETFLQTYILAALAKSFVPLDRLLRVEETLLRCQALEDRIDVLLRLSDETELVKKRRGEIVKSFYGRVKSGIEFEPKFEKIKSSITLCKPTESIFPGSSEDYDVEELCEGSVSVHTFSGNHFTILKNTCMANEINKIISNR